MPAAPAPASDFAAALRAFDVPAMRAHLAHDAWPDSLVGLPPWHWVVDNAIARLNGGARHPKEVVKGLREQFALLRQTRQDASREDVSDRDGTSNGGCLHRLLIMGSIRSLPIDEVAQCILEEVPDVAHHIRNRDGLTAHELLLKMGQSPSEHNLPAFHRAWSAREALLREQKVANTAPLRTRRPRQRA